MKSLSSKSLRKFLAELASDRRYKSFGDSLINFLYSYHLFLVKGEIRGIRVKNTLLARICDSLGDCCPKRLGIHGKADLIEAIVAYCLLNDLITLESILSMIREENFLEKLALRCIKLIEQELLNEA